MSFPKKGRIFPKKGNNFLGEDGATRYSAVIAAALRREVGGTHRAAKTVVRWTGASERTVKNWIAGATGPRGEHLIALARESDAVFEAFLLLTGKGQTAAGKQVNTRDTLLQIISQLQMIVDQGEQSESTGAACT
jgi:hypothetical protein